MRHGRAYLAFMITMFVASLCTRFRMGVITASTFPAVGILLFIDLNLPGKRRMALSIELGATTTSIQPEMSLPDKSIRV